MRWYSDFPAQRTRQIIGDAVAAGIVLIGILVAIVMGSLIAGFGEVGHRIAEVGSGFEATMQDFGDALAGIPLIGEPVAQQVSGAAEAGASMAAAGSSIQQAVAVIAVLTGLLIALAPIGLVAVVWLLPRSARARRGARLRALIGADGELDVEGFVELELRRAGVRR